MQQQPNNDAELNQMSATADYILLAVIPNNDQTQSFFFLRHDTVKRVTVSSVMSIDTFNALDVIQTLAQGLHVTPETTIVRLQPPRQ